MYGNLHPGTFRFKVIAANNDGVWNRTGASVTIIVPPTFIQTWPFRIACAIALGLLAWLAYTLRLRQLSERIRARLEERTSEREAGVAYRTVSGAADRFAAWRLARGLWPRAHREGSSDGK